MDCIRSAHNGSLSLAKKSFCCVRVGFVCLVKGVGTMVPMAKQTRNAASSMGLAAEIA